MCSVRSSVVTISHASVRAFIDLADSTRYSTLYNYYKQWVYGIVVHGGLISSSHSFVDPRVDQLNSTLKLQLKFKNLDIFGSVPILEDT